MVEQIDTLFFVSVACFSQSWEFHIQDNRKL